MAALAIGGPRYDLAPGPGARINPHHPLSRGLKVFATPWYDLVKGNTITPTSCTPGTNHIGLGALLGSGSRLDMVDDPDLHAWTEYTIVGWGAVTGSTLYFATRDVVTPSPFFGVSLHHSGTAIHHISQGTTGPYSAASTVSNPSTLMIGGTAQDGLVSVWSNGVLMASDTNANGPLADSPNPWSFGYVAWFPDYSAGILGPVMMWNRVLNAGEMLQVYSTPFCMLASG